MSKRRLARVVPLKDSTKLAFGWAAGVRGGWLVTPQVLSYGNIGFTSARFSDATLVRTFAGGPGRGMNCQPHGGGWVSRFGVGRPRRS